MCCNHPKNDIIHTFWVRILRKKHFWKKFSSQYPINRLGHFGLAENGILINGLDQKFQSIKILFPLCPPCFILYFSYIYVHPEVIIDKIFGRFSELLIVENFSIPYQSTPYRGRLRFLRTLKVFPFDGLFISIGLKFPQLLPKFK